MLASILDYINVVGPANTQPSMSMQVPHSTRTQAFPNISCPDGGDRRKKTDGASLPSKRIRLFHDNSSCAAMAPGMSVTAPDWKPSAPSAPEACQVRPTLMYSPAYPVLPILLHLRPRLSLMLRFLEFLGQNME